MAYKMIREFKSDTKIWKTIYLKDLGFIMGYFFIMMVLGQDHVHQALLLPYYAFNAIVAIILTIHSPWNPGKRIYHTLLFTFAKDRRVYAPVITADIQKELSKLK